jgi:hypothetical protein
MERNKSLALPTSLPEGDDLLGSTPLHLCHTGYETCCDRDNSASLEADGNAPDSLSGSFRLGSSRFEDGRVRRCSTIEVMSAKLIVFSCESLVVNATL